MLRRPKAALLSAHGAQCSAFLLSIAGTPFELHGGITEAGRHLRERSTGRMTILRPYNCLNHIAYIRDFQMDPVGAIPDDRREILLQVQRGPQWPGNACPASTPPYSSG